MRIDWQMSDKKQLTDYNDEDWLTIVEICDLMGKGHYTILKLVHRFDIPYQEVGFRRKFLIRFKDLTPIFEYYGWYF